MSASIHFLDYAVIVIYMLAVLGIGFYFSRNEKNSEDYLLGGRNMPYVAIGLSCVMSLLSSISIVMVPGEIFSNGLALFFLAPFGLILTIPFYLIFTRFYFKLGSFTPYEYLEYRYDKKVRTLIAVIGLYTRISYLGMVLFTTSKIFVPRHPASAPYEDRIYNFYGNYQLMQLRTLTSNGTVAGSEEHPLALAGGAKFYQQDIADGIGDSRIPRPIEWPHNPESYLLISAGLDGEYGTADDVRNFGN